MAGDVGKPDGGQRGKILRPDDMPRRQQHLVLLHVLASLAHVGAHLESTGNLDPLDAALRRDRHVLLHDDGVDAIRDDGPGENADRRSWNDWPRQCMPRRHTRRDRQHGAPLGIAVATGEGIAIDRRVGVRGHGLPSHGVFGQDEPVRVRQRQPPDRGNRLDAITQNGERLAVAQSAAIGSEAIVDEFPAHRPRDLGIGGSRRA